MRVEIRLSDEDRERLGLSSEWIEYDHDKVGIKLIAEVQKTLGLTPAEFDRGIAGGDAFAVWGLAWIAVRMAGVDASLEDFDFQINQMASRRPDAPTDTAPDGPGKDDPAAPAETPTTRRSSTTKTSSRSSASTRSRSRT